MNDSKSLNKKVDYMVNSNSFYKTKIEHQNEELTTMNKKLDSLVSDLDYLKFKSNSSKLIIYLSYLNKLVNL